MSILPTLLIGAGAGGGGTISTSGTLLNLVVAASTTALTVTYSNGTAGVGATLTNAGTQAIFALDARNPIVGQRVLIKNQTSAFQNGVYSVTNIGSASSNWILTRVTDFDTAAEMTFNAIVEVMNGSVNASTVWQLMAAISTVGTDALNFAFVNISTKVDQNGSPIYGIDSGSANTYVITLKPAPTIYVAGMVFNFLAANANTTASTLNVNSLGAKAITKFGSTALVANDILAGQEVHVIYDGTQFQMVSPATGGMSTGVTSITGTANQIAASASTGAVTLSIPSTFIAPGSIAATTTISGTTINSSTLTINTALISDGSKNIISSSTTATELSYVHGVTSAIQTQINAITGSIVTAIAGTTNQIAVSASTGSVILSIPNTFVAPGTITSTGLLTGSAGLTIIGAASNIGADSRDDAINIGTGASSGRTITIGNITGTTGIVLRIGTGNYSLDGVTSSTYNIGASTTTGTIIIGGTAQSGTLTLGSSSTTSTVAIAAGLGNTVVTIGNAASTQAIVNVANNATTATVNIATGTGTMAINIATGATNPKTINIGTGAVANVIAIGNITGATSVTISAGSGTIALIGTVSVSSLTASQLVVTDGSKNLTSLLILPGNQGGTGFNNGSNTIAFNGNVNFSGAFTTTFNITATTNLTLPTSGVVSTDTYSGLNIIVNGDFQIWQRGAGGSASFAVPASTTQYTADRWQIKTNANQACTVTQTAGATSGSYLATVQRNSGQTGTGSILYCTSLTRDMCVGAAGNVVTLGLTVACGANFSGITGILNFTVYSGTGTTDISGINGAFTGSTVVATGTIVPFTIPQVFTTTTSTLGSTVTQLAIQFSWTPVGTAGAADSIVLKDMCGFIGPAIHPYTRKTFLESLLNCQRFFFKTFAYGTAPAQAVGAGTGEQLYSSNVAGALQNNANYMEYPVLMRATPTIVTYNPVSANAQVRDESANADCTATTIVSSTARGYGVAYTGAVGTFANDQMGLHSISDCDVT